MRKVENQEHDIAYIRTGYGTPRTRRMFAHEKARCTVKEGSHEEMQEGGGIGGSP
jgi:hypothetical protein